jgi:hypothetical protein
VTHVATKNVKVVFGFDPQPVFQSDRLDLQVNAEETKYFYMLVTVRQMNNIKLVNKAFENVKFVYLGKTVLK